MENDIDPLQLGFDIGAVIAQTTHWKNTKRFQNRARSMLIALDVDHRMVDDPLFIFGLGQGCGYRHTHPKDVNVEGEAKKLES